MAAEQMRTGVLCIHGIQGSPRQFDWLTAVLPGHVAMENLLLPGHGRDVRAFRNSGMKQWQACVDAAIEHMSAQRADLCGPWLRGFPSISNVVLMKTRRVLILAR